ncbi:RNA polymerase sigma factor [Flavobacterium sp. CS20]|jgi:RNA polymerase sigma-70 factor (ECF subfamily)|uniref:RNA polymerase sigma factor n=1 Tax=Flavobacterium sp. CS20 TaxID=2775246 RepID=UPI001B3A0648|nr:sigma-70 family RNA polymerase sigma factor [Flavobacterium sp. CS20]QTY27679.1 sigma-70 family RNA polymerase sigma factor [Flavobacterium sp. CS20]
MKQQHTISEAELIRSYLDGNEHSLCQLINRHKHKIFGFIISKIQDRNLAEDVFQDTFIKVINTLKRGKYNEEGKFLPWVMRIAHNLVIDHFRKSNRMPKFDTKTDFDIFSVIKDEDLNVESNLIKDQIENDVKSLLKELPDDQREVLEMRIYNEYSFKEIAYKTDVSINTALGRMRYALINLRKIIEERNIILTEK